MSFCNFSGHLRHAILSSTNNEFEDIQKEFGSNSTECEFRIMEVDSQIITYLLEDTHTIDNLTQFVNKYLNKELKRKLKSQPIPESNDDPVRVVVTDSFQKEIYDQEKSVLLEFYAPWCGHCKKLAPTYEKLAEKLLNSQKVVIAKIDSTENDTPDFNI